MTAPTKRDQPPPRNMPDAATWHPDPNMLVAFANGAGSEKSFRQIEAHLTHCNACVATIESLDCAHEDYSLFSPNWQKTVGNGDNDSDDQLETATENRESGLPVSSIGPYRLKEIIGEGGMGVVYRAEQQTPIQRTVALKILKPGLTSAPFVKRFKSERQTLAILQHPNVAKMLDAGETDQGRLYFVMEFIDGIPIVEYSNNHCLKIPERLKLFGDVCSAVEHAHQKAIIHRDLKPSNVLVSEMNGHPQPKVIDFGIAKTLNPPDQSAFVTGVGQIVGTLEYLSPEQLYLDSSSVDTRTDVYQLGAVLYELLTNQPPLGIHNRSNNTIDDIARVIREREPMLPSIRLSHSDSLDQLAQDCSTTSKRLVKCVRGDLDWITAKTLEKKPARRYQSVRELANDIQRHLNNEPLSIAAPSITYRVQKSIRRHKVAFSFAAMMILSMISLAGLTVFLVIAARATETSEKQLRYNNFVANVRNAQHYFSKNNVRKATKLLSGLIPESGEEEDLRGFEWFYTWDQCHPEQLIRSVDYAAPLHDIAFSPDGSMYAVAAGKKTATLFDAATHKVLFETRLPIAGLAVDFTTDNRHLIVACGQGKLFVVDTTTRKTLFEHQLSDGAIHDVAIDPLGRYVAVAGESIWILNTSSLGEHIDIGTQRPGGCLEFSPDGQLLVASEDPDPELNRVCQLVLYECGGDWSRLDSKDAVSSQFRTTHLNSLLVMPDDQTVVCAFSHGVAVSWKIIRNGDSNPAKLANKPDKAVTPPNESGLTNIKLSGDQRFLSAARNDGTVQIWELEKDKSSVYRGTVTTPFMEQKAHSNPARAVEFLPNENAFASVGRDGRINFWEIERDRDRLFFGLNAPTAIDCRDGNLLVGNSQEIICWDNSKQNIRYRIPSSDNSMIYSVEFFLVQRESRAVVLDGQGTVRVLNAQDGSFVDQFKLPSNSRLAVNPSKQEFVVAVGDNRLQRYGFDGALIDSIGTHDDRISRIAIGNSGEIVSCSIDGTIKFWDSKFKHAKTYQTDLWPMSIAYSEAIHCIAAGVGSNVHIFDTTTDQQQILWGHTADIKCLDFSANGARLASGGKDAVVILWETKTWKNVATFDQFFVDHINCLKFSPDDQTLGVGTKKNFVWPLEAPRN